MLHDYPENLRKLRYLKAEIKDEERDFPGGPVVKTLPSNAGSTGLLPGQGAKILQASHPKNQKHRSNIVTNSVKTQNGAHQKNL